MLWAVPFAVALCAGFYYAMEKGGGAERCTIGILLAVWVGTVATNFYTGLAAPYMAYAALDVAALALLYDQQRRNWQWIPAALFTAMLLTHLLYWGVSTVAVAPSAFAYQSIIAVLAYAQIASVIWASHERSRVREGRNLGKLGHWALADTWLFVRAPHHSANAES